MLLLPLALALTLQASPPQQAPPAPAPAARPAPKTYNETADAKAAIDAAVKSAALDEIRVLINWGSNDSEQAAKFAALRRQREFGPLFSDEYKLVFVDVGHGDRNLDVAGKYGASIAPDALPALTILDHTGKVLAQASSRDFRSDADPAAVDAAKVSAFLTKYKAPAPDAVGPFDAALARAKREGKSVFVWFSAPW
jgi:hypothetical protein